MQNQPDPYAGKQGNGSSGGRECRGLPPPSPAFEPVRPGKPLTSTKDLHVPGIIIVAGNQVDAEIQDIHEDDQVDVDFEESVGLAFNKLLTKSVKAKYGTLDEYKDYEIRFYEIGRQAESKQQGWSYSFRSLQARKSRVSVTSYLLGTDAIIGDPHSVVADPHSVVADPHSVVADPVSQGEFQRLWEASAETQFKSQWAFTGTYGVSGPYDTGGAGTSVVIFDTYPTPGNQPPVSASFDKEAGVCVVPMTGHFFVPDGNGAHPFPEDVRNHGLFITSLIKAMAPETQIDVIQVLDENGTGDAATLIYSLFQYMHQVIVDDGKDGLQDHVFNLSLGLERESEIDESHEALNKVIKFIHALGGVVVAAAGNETSQFTGRLPAQIPADMPETISVGASTKQGARAHFSNDADVFAPGGHGEAGDCHSMVRNCIQQHLADAKLSDCEAGLIGRIRRRPAQSEQPTPAQNASRTKAHYGIASGTSFSTALVSGMAAVLLSEAARLGKERKPKRIKEWLEASTGETGVVHLGRALKAMNNETGKQVAS